MTAVLVIHKTGSNSKEKGESTVKFTRNRLIQTDQVSFSHKTPGFLEGTENKEILCWDLVKHLDLLPRESFWLRSNSR